MRRGFTLVEMLVAGTLLLLALGLAFGYLIPAIGAANRYRVRSHLQQTAVVALGQIQEASTTTSPGGFSWSAAAPVAMAFNPYDDVQPANSLLVWSALYDVFWWDQNEKQLRRRSWPPGDPTPLPAELSVLRAKRLPVARVALLTAEGSQSVLARGVTELTLTHQGPNPATLVQPLKISLTLVEEGRENDPAGAISVSHTLTFRMVNQR